MEQNIYDFPTEEVTLPSKGRFYNPESPLSSGKVTMKYMTAKEEDILTNKNYLRKGIDYVIDKLLKAMIVENINVDDLLIGDKNALIIATRILGYGKDFTFMYEGEEITVDLTELNDRVCKLNPIEEGKNEFEYKIPSTEDTITFQLMTQKTEKRIKEELDGLRKTLGDSLPEVTTTLAYQILSVNGERGSATVRKFCNNMLAKDRRDFSKYVAENQPDIVDLIHYEDEDGRTRMVKIPFDISLIYPDLD